MRLLWTLAVIPGFAVALPKGHSYHTHNYYLLEHDPSFLGASLGRVTRALGVEIVGQVGELRHHWLVRSEKPPIPLSARTANQHEVDPVLSRFDAVRQKASSTLHSRSEDLDGLLARAIFSSVLYLERQTLRQREKRAPPLVRPPPSASSTAKQFGIQDPMFGRQWHISNDEHPEHTMNVASVWEMGITGKGVVSSVIDDGLDFTSKDLAVNFVPEFSYDFNDHESLPYPKKVADHHGTRCAGQIAAAKNDRCGVGIAYDSKVAGVRILSGPVTDVDEAAALNYGYQNVSIYSCSWGPRDDGKSMGAPSYLVKKAVLNGINNGRGGKGSIFVFASGNGGGYEDQCNFDGYTNSIYSVTVGAVDHAGNHPWYSEACAANMIVAYSSGAGQHIVTTDRGEDKCATHHGGTSAAAPNAAGVFALSLQARPDLTWRDIQYLALQTAKEINPKDPDWETTATGRRYSYKYGYGVLDGFRFVTAAQKWKLVKPQAWFDSLAVQLGGGMMDGSRQYVGGISIAPEGVKSKITLTRDMLKEGNFESLEHLTVQVWIDHTRRGDVEVEVVSPNGIKSVLAKMRSNDEATTGFPGWVFMSVKHWGEDPVGDWTIKVSDQGSQEESGKFLGWRMRLWGTTIDPSVAEKYTMPLVDDVLPPVHNLYRPEIHVPMVINHHAKPAEYPNPITVTDVGKANDYNLMSEILGTFHRYTHKVFMSSAVALIFVGFFGTLLYWRHSKTAPGYEVVGRDDLQLAAGEEQEGPRSPVGPHPQDRVSVGLGFHSGFLDDDDMSTAPPTPKFRDGSDNGDSSMTGSSSGP